MIQTTEKNRSLTFNVRVVPRASKSEIVGEHDGALKIRLCAPPTGGAANAELVKLLSKTFGVSKSEVQILNGQTAKTKQVCISNITSKNLTDILPVKN
ncbi:MAG: YggU family protein [Acidobacteria bacterium]|jgi:uncharacterized protein (TIGR00251 family)|nr:YggU family protein [Acidobacteriota bacterium]